MPDGNETLRIDRWLYFCRFYKTRSKAADAVTGGHVRINGERAAPGSRVRRGDLVELLRERLPYKLRVTGIPVRRGPAAEAQDCYLEDADTASQRAATAAVLKQDRILMPRTDGRPDKRTRRQLIRRNRDH